MQQVAIRQDDERWPEMFSPKDLAAYLSISPRAAYNLMAALPGRFKLFDGDSRQGLRVPRASVEQFVRDRQQQDLKDRRKLPGGE